MAIRLTEAQTKRLFKHINEKWSNRRECPMCHGHKWTVDSSVYRLAAMTTDLSTTHNAVQPLATVRCVNCSFVALVHLIQSGVATAEELSVSPPDAPMIVPHVETGPVQLAPERSDEHADERDATG